MRVIDTFLFSEEYEADLLFLKLTLESNIVDKWIIQENAYTLKGEFKDLHAENVINQPRFTQFRDRIVIESRKHLTNTDQSENSNFIRERIQRAFCLNFLQKYANDSDLIIVSDTDEMIDFSNQERKQRFFDIAEKNVCAWVGRRRYWYQHNNECRLNTIRIPVINYGLLRNNMDLITQVRYFNDPNSTFDSYDNPIAFEYSYVFKNVDELFRKKCTYAHTGFDRESVEIGVKCNHWPRSKARGEALGSNPCDFFEIIELTETNSPKYVRDNLATINTNVVDPNYKANRLGMYGNQYDHLYVS